MTSIPRPEVLKAFHRVSLETSSMQSIFRFLDSGRGSLLSENMHSSICSFVVWIAVSPTVCLSWVNVANLSPLVLDTLRRVFGGFIWSQGACLEGLEDNPIPKFRSKKHSESYGYLFSREKGFRCTLSCLSLTRYTYSIAEFFDTLLRNCKTYVYM